MKIKTRWSVWAAIAAASALGSLSTMAAPIKLLPPQQGIYQGVFADIPEFPLRGQIESKTARFEQLVGKNVAFSIVGNSWVNGIQFPLLEVTAVHAAGRVPVVHIKPWSEKIRGLGADRNYSFERILAGWFDQQLTNYAIAARNFGRPIVISFSPEANGNWYPWSGIFQGGRMTTGYGDPTRADGPERYRDTYRRLVNIFNRNGADNVTWIFHVNADNKPREPWNNMAAYYPGDQYVDWLGVSVYSAQYPGDQWDDFTVSMDPAYRELTNLAPAKPIAILEFGIIEDQFVAFRKADWISNALSALRSNRYPKVKAVAYWHESAWIRTGENDMRVNSSPSALQAYQNEIADPVFVASARLSRPSIEGCLCGWVQNGSAGRTCAIWKPGDATVHEWHNFSECSLPVCQQLFTPDTVQNYCGGRITLNP